MSKHTPGPWTSGHHGNVALWVGPSHLAHPVALVPWDSHAEARDEARDNARLIAAAPDLLEALKEILPWHDFHPLEQTDNRIVNLCREAISKAKGRS
jgi:hypothetical protein